MLRPFRFRLEKSACQQTKDVIAEYEDISNNLEHLSSNYKHGKFIYGKTKNSIKQDLSSSQEEIIRLSNYRLSMISLCISHKFHSFFISNSKSVYRQVNHSSISMKAIFFFFLLELFPFCCFLFSLTSLFPFINYLLIFQLKF